MDTYGRYGLNTTDGSKEGIAEYLLRNPNTCFVAEDNGIIVGVIMSGHDGHRDFIYHTTVKQELRGQGIGKKLVGPALAALEANDILYYLYCRNSEGEGYCTEGNQAV